MNKPKLKKWQDPDSISNYPMGATCDSDNLTSVSSGMRTFRPIIDKTKCIKCMRCFLLCPDGVIDKSNNELEIDYDYCKGCGVCAYECKLKAITMEEEGNFND